MSYIKTIFFEDKVLPTFHHFDCGMSLLVGAALVPCSGALCTGPGLCIRDEMYYSGVKCDAGN